MNTKLVRFGVLFCAACLMARSVRAEDTLQVVASVADLGDLARVVGGSDVQVTTLASGVQDPHFVDPRPSYVVKLRDADVLLAMGLDLEQGWLPSLVQSARNADLRPGGSGYVDCSSGVTLLDLPSAGTTRAEGDVHPRGNPHYLTDPLNAGLVAQTIATAFARARPAHTKAFAERARGFVRALDELLFGKDLVQLVGGAKLERVTRAGELDAFLASESLTPKLGGVFARMRGLRGAKLAFHHKSYSYFVARFGLEVVGYVEPKPGIPPSGAQLDALIAKLKSEHVRAVVTHPFYDQKVAGAVAHKAGAALVVLPLGVGGVPAASSYLAYVDVVTKALASALAGAP